MPLNVCISGGKAYTEDYTGLVKNTRRHRVCGLFVNVAQRASLGVDHIPDRNALPESVAGDGGIILQRSEGGLD
jgi:hypothetical protein